MTESKWDKKVKLNVPNKISIVNKNGEKSLDMRSSQYEVWSGGVCLFVYVKLKCMHKSYLNEVHGKRKCTKKIIITNILWKSVIYLR